MSQQNKQTFCFRVSVLGEERQKLLTSLEIRNVNEKGLPLGESGGTASPVQSPCATEAVAQGLGSKTS